MKSLLLTTLLLLMCVQNVYAQDFNGYREANGRKPWKHNAQLQASAQHSAYLIASGKRGWSHAGYTSYISKYYRGWWTVGENLAKDFATPEQALAAWKVSPSHNKNLLSAKTCEYGFGQYGTVYVLHTGCK